MSIPNRMFHGLTSGFVNQSKTWESFFILHPCAVLFIFVPVLKIITGIGPGKNDFPISDGEREIGLRLGVNLHRGFPGKIKGSFRMRMVVIEGREVGPVTVTTVGPIKFIDR